VGAPRGMVFPAPPSLRGVAQSMGLEMTRPGRVYIIRNSMLTATEAKTIERRTISIAQRAINSLIHTQGLGDLYRIYMTTTRDGFDFNLAYIGSDFMYENKKEEVAARYMRARFAYAFSLGRQASPWRKAPPGLETALGL